MARTQTLHEVESAIIWLCNREDYVKDREADRLKGQSPWVVYSGNNLVEGSATRELALSVAARTQSRCVIRCLEDPTVQLDVDYSTRL
jgi:hypothetical protein